MIDPSRLRAAWQVARSDLWGERDASGHWTGELSSSALSTATAISALALVRRHATGWLSQRIGDAELSELIFAGLHYLVSQQNDDGGWGDTDQSRSNIATTMLVQAALRLTCLPANEPDLWARSEEYIAAAGGLKGLRRRYGRDKTFVVPILTNCALAGLVPWRKVPSLPFELACFPQAWFRFLRLPVVSYAIPALVAMGQAKYHFRKPLNPLISWVRRRSREPSLAVIERMQPDSGGYLEATPLTSFVVMSLASIGQADHRVVQRGVDFLLNSVRSDGAWPIDTNLATWNTTLAINALAAGGEIPLLCSTPDVYQRRPEVATAALLPATNYTHPMAEAGPTAQPETIDLNWLLGCQHQSPHPFTGAAPGGWGWSDLSGAVPDADDTSGALLALAALRAQADPPLRRLLAERAKSGLAWLLSLQNADGGWPTFCRGWGKLPFDRSGVDLTAHVLRAIRAWSDPAELAEKQSTEVAGSENGNGPAGMTESVTAAALQTAVERGFRFIDRQQRPDGSWVPLWFGNQFHPQEENLVYGTSRTLVAYNAWERGSAAAAGRGVAWLLEHQNADGGWGCPQTALDAGSESAAPPQSTVEETALAVEALLSCSHHTSEMARSVEAGVDWLCEAIETKQHRRTSPIGLYFAKLWYYEKMYPLVFTTAALGRALRRQGEEHPAADRQSAHATPAQPTPALTTPALAST